MLFKEKRLLLESWDGWGYTFYNLSISLFFEGVLLLIFGGCLGTSLVEGYATARYGVNPAVARDTRQHFSERRSQLTASALVFLAAGGIILAIALLLLSLAPLWLPQSPLGTALAPEQTPEVHISSRTPAITSTSAGPPSTESLA